MILFAGPSLNSESKHLIQSGCIDLRPPVQRGDIAALTQNMAPGSLTIVDGVFHQVLSVGHEEILNAIEKGWNVHGLSSMGAIRAYELRNFGMNGYGDVYQRFFSTEDFQDDELALLHQPEPPYLAFSEPLIHFRYCVEKLVLKELLTSKDGSAIIGKLKGWYFGERTIEAFELLLKHYLRVTTPIISDFDQYRIKQHDLVSYLREIVGRIKIDGES